MDYWSFLAIMAVWVIIEYPWPSVPVAWLGGQAEQAGNLGQEAERAGRLGQEEKDGLVQ